MIDHADPEKPQFLHIEKLRMDQLWRQGQIFDNTYLRSLFIMGYLPKDANVELNLLKLENSQRVKDHSVA